MATSLIDLQRSHILDLIQGVRTENGYKILILDQMSWSLITEVVEPSELLNIVTALERVDDKRETRSGVEAIYILEPCEYSVDCLLSDYKISPTRYKAAHIFFLPGLTNDIASTIKSSVVLQRHLATFKEFNLCISPKESHAFITNNPNSLQIFYNKQCHDLVTTAVQQTATALVNVCVLTGEYPIIRYYVPTENDGYFNASVLPKMIATEFQDQLDDYARKHPDFPPTSTRQRSIFIITDRTLDLFAPLLHEFTYQAMAYDLKAIGDDDIYKYEAENEKGIKEPKESKLGDSDPDWVKLRHLHIIDSKELVTSRLEEFLTKNQMLVDRSNIKSTSDILTAVARLKGFDEERRRIVLHKSLVEDLLLTNGEKNLPELAEFEQNLASFGIDIDNERVKNLADTLIDLLNNPEYGLEDKLRLIVLYGLYRGGLIEKDYIKLFNFMGILEPQELQSSLEYISNIETIGFKMIKPNLKSKSIFKREFLHTIVNEGSFNTSRFRPAINAIIANVISNTLSDERFPYIKDKPIDLETDISRTNSTSTTSLKNPKHRPVWSKQNSQFQPPKQRIFYFIAGGATHSELRSVYELSVNFDKEVIIGSDEILTPRKFLNEVKNLSNLRQYLKLKPDFEAQRPTKAPAHLLEKPREKRIPVPQGQPQPQGNIPSHLREDLNRTDTVKSNFSDKPGKRSRFKKFLKG